MFLKPLKIRSQNQLKTSDKKRLGEEISKSFPDLTTAMIESLFPKKEEVLILKIETGSKLLIPVYVVQDKPILFLYNQNLIPTLHMLWKCPNIILVFKTHSEVLSKIVDGADLMLPGVIEPTSSTMPTFIKDTPACIMSVTKLIPVAVGVTASNSDNMASYVKGKCIHTLHVIGDKLYNLKNTASNIPSPLEELLTLLKTNHINIEEITSNEEIINPVNNAEYQTLNNIENLESDESNEERGCSLNNTDEMDNLLMHTLCSAIKYSKGLQVPLLTSNFFKMNMVPACPLNKILDVKKSSYKKCGVFMKHMMELGILKVEEQKKGIEYITEFNYDHPFISEFYVDPSERPKVAKQVEDTIKPVISEAHSVTAAVLPIFSEFNFKKGSTIDNSEIRKLVTHYVKQHNLQDEDNKSYVNLNAALRCTSYFPRCTFEDLIKNIYTLMSPCYKIVCGNSEIVHKGKLEPINIVVAKRSGNKKVTLVDNIEIYGINIAELGNICQRGIAASTTIIRSENPKKSSQLLLQGNQVLFVYNLLTEKCLIPKRYIRGLEFAPKKQH